MPQKIDVVAGIIWRDGLFLAVQRPPGSVQEGFWEFPGGKIEPGETPEQALVRELHEELGIDATDFDYWREKSHEYEHAHVRLFFFHIHAFDGSPVAKEGQAFTWIRPGEPHGLEFLPADEEILAELSAQN